MAYTPKTWQCDDVITADELNRMEQGIAEASQSGGGTEPLIVHETKRAATAEECEDGGFVYTLDHTWQEIHDALAVGKNVVLVDNNSSEATLIVSVMGGDIGYLVTARGREWLASSANEYPKNVVCGGAPA